MTDPARAEQLAIAIFTDPQKRQDRRDLLDFVALRCVSVDPARAERLARAGDARVRVWVLTALGKACADSDHVRAGRLIDDAEQAARDVEEWGRASALLHVAGAAAAINRSRASQLFNEAARFAHAMEAHVMTVVNVVTDIIQACASIAPAAAEQLINDEERHARLVLDYGQFDYIGIKILAKLAVACADIDASRAERLINDAEQAARRITDPATRARIQTDLAKTCAGIYDDIHDLSPTARWQYIIYNW
jgi:hypothetical protein